MNKLQIYIPKGMSSHISNSVFPIIGARFAVKEKKNRRCIREKSDEKTVSKDNGKNEMTTHRNLD